MTSPTPRFVVVLVLVAAVGSPGCDDGAANLPPPQFTNLGLDIQAWDHVPGSTAGGFTFVADNPDAPFTAFGSVNDGKTWTNIEFKARLDAQVLAPMDGIVEDVVAQETADEGYEIRMRSAAGSTYQVILDHVRNPTVAAGDSVTAGDVLGVPGAWSAYAGQFELQVNNDANHSAVCPMTLVAAASKAAIEGSLNQLMADWESLKGDTAIFDEQGMTVPGCIGLEISE